MQVSQSCSTICAPMNFSPAGPLSMKFSRQEYWSVLSFPSPGDLPNPGIKPGSSVLQADFLPSEPPEKPSLKVVSSPSWWGCNEPQNWSIYPTNSIPHWLKFAPGGLKLQHFQVALYAEASSRGLGESFHAGRGRYLK